MPKRDKETPADADHNRRAEPLTYAVDWVHRECAAEELVTELEQRATRRRRRRAAVVSGAVVLLTAAGFGWRSSNLFVDSMPMAETASVIMPVQHTLADGSEVELNDGAEIAVDFTATTRRVTLQRGEAHFQVTKDSERPFVVTVGRFEVRAVGTAFLVSLEPAAAEVLVTEGSVAVGSGHQDHHGMERGDSGLRPVGSNDAEPERPASGRPSASLGGVAGSVIVAAGNRALLDVSIAGASRPRVEAVPEAEIAARLRWRIPRLEFSGTSLADAVKMFNQHNGVQLVLADPSLARLKVSGFLRADKTQTFLSLLESEFGLTADQSGTVIQLRRASAR